MTADSPPIFLSYARAASRPAAEAVFHALGGSARGPAFLDTSGIERGERFPDRIVDALFGARVVVVFAEPVYFTRWYCLVELGVARLPFLHLCVRGGGTRAEHDAALAPMVVVVPAGGPPPDLERFPPAIRDTSWPSLADPGAAAAFILERLERSPRTIAELIAGLGGDAERERARILGEARLPPPLRAGEIPTYPLTGLRPSIGDRFVGRGDDLWRVHDALSAAWGELPAAASLMALEGSGGVGKTRLAVEYLHRFGPRYFPGGLFWMDAEREVEPQQYGVLRALDPAVPDLESVRQYPDGVAGALARALRRVPPETPALLVVDNVPEPAAGAPPQPLATWCPAVGHVAVLATSRVRLAAGDWSVRGIAVDVLEGEAAVALLARGVERSALAPEEWAAIAEWVGRLPLALELLNRVLAAHTRTPRQLFAAIGASTPTRELDEAMAVLRGSVPAGHLRGITEALSLSYQRLSPAEREAARLLAWLGPEPIPHAVLDALGPDVFPAAIRARLAGLSFVTPEMQAGTLFGSMHRVLADFLRSQSSAPAAELGRVAAALQPLLPQRDPRADGLETAPDGATRELCCRHAEAVFQRALGGAPTAEWVVFGAQLGVALFHQGQFSRAVPVLEASVEASLHMFGGEDRNTLILMNNLADARGRRGELDEAQELQEYVLDIRRRVLGEEHHDTITSLIDLAGTLEDRGELERAEALLHYAWTTSLHALGPEHSETLRALHSLATVTLERGDLGRAQDLLMRVWENSARTLGEEHPETLITLGALGKTLLRRGDIAAARAIFAQVLEVSRRVLGDDHPSTGEAMNHLSSALWKGGDFQAARGIQEQVVEMHRRTLGENHPRTLGAMNNLATILGPLGEVEEASRLARHVWGAARQAFGDEHPKTLACLNTYACCVSRTDHDEGKRLLFQVVDAHGRLRGERHGDTTLYAFNLFFQLMSTPEPDPAAHGVFETYLAWLLDCGPELLSGDQRQIREHLLYDPAAGAEDEEAGLLSVRPAPCRALPGSAA